MLLDDLSQPGTSVSKAPQEAEVGPGIDPTTQHRRLVQQDRRQVEQPVELHRSLDDQWEHIGGERGAASRHDHNYIIPVSRKGNSNILK